MSDCKRNFLKEYTLWISRCIATARERIPGSIDNDVTGVSECSQQRGNLKDDGYNIYLLKLNNNIVIEKSLNI
ncbi:hypothetical protein [Photorhabdus sp. RW14-46]|uniref:hypothetical protein n=1 Tax=Photorhabdus sp. RW14-46 TaxID=2100168 RepID=UPI0013F45CB4|nr:hypothetical protein [Photorhabdus sp. RW14-46]